MFHYPASVNHLLNRKDTPHVAMAHFPGYVKSFELKRFDYNRGFPMPPGDESTKLLGHLEYKVAIFAFRGTNSWGVVAAGPGEKYKENHHFSVYNGLKPLIVRLSKTNCFKGFKNSLSFESPQIAWIIEIQVARSSK
jgi:hypothetical protein